MKYNGRAYEAVMARVQRRPAQALFHAALEVTAHGVRSVIEVAPIPDGHGPRDRGVVLEGPVGARWASRLRLFRYELRRWPGGEIPDRAWAVDSPQRVAHDETTAARVLDLVPDVPALVWGRDELGAGDMWNSNSVVSWLLSRG
ncbi:MAG: hypothetical protein ACEQSX_15095, partial [Baekduiaceae bacterium]